MIYSMVAYAIFLIITAKKASVHAVKERYFGKQLEDEGLK